MAQDEQQADQEGIKMTISIKHYFMVGLGLLMAVSAFAADWVSTKEFDIKYPFFISGLYAAGKDVTEPKKMKSRFLAVDDGGVLLTEAGAKLFVRVRSIEPPEGEMFLKAEFADPSGRVTFAELEFKKDGTFMFTSPEAVRGLKGKNDYIITVGVYLKKDPGRPVDSVVQKVRSYVDTQKNDTQIFDGIFKKE